jgi:hypothetical protein
MRFEPKTKEELSNLLPDGIYEFSVLSAEETVSKKGNDMIALKLEVYDDGNGKTSKVPDWLVNSEKTLRKVLGFCEATGILDIYNSGQLTADHCTGKSGRVKLVVQDAQDNFPAKNSVDYYVAGSKLPLAPVNRRAAPTGAKPARKGAAAYPDPNAQGQPDEDIPF